MLLEYCKETLWACGIVVILAVTAVILKAAFAYIFAQQQASLCDPASLPAAVEIKPEIVAPNLTEAVDVIPEAVPVEPVLVQPVLVQPVLVQPIDKAARPHANGSLAPAVVCATCGKNIRSKPSKMEGNRIYFRCEHCHETVMLA